jgi:hypothetical protein
LEFSQYNIINTVTGGNIQIWGELKGSPVKMRYNEKIPLDNRVIIQSSGLMFDGSFTIDYIDENNFLLLEYAWINNNEIIIENIDGRRYKVTIIGEKLDIFPKQNNIDNTVIYSGSFNVKGGI